MNPADNVEKAIKKLTLPGTKAGDERILNDAFAALERAGCSKSATMQFNIWRIITTVKTAKLVAAAVFAIAMGIGLAVLSRSSDNVEQRIVKEIKESSGEKPDMAAPPAGVNITKGYPPAAGICDRFDDSSYGIPVEGLTRNEACHKILEHFWDAVIFHDLARIRQLLPVAADWDDEVLKDSLGLTDEDYLVELLEIGKPYDKDTSDIGRVIVPNIFRCVDGWEREVQMIIQFCRVEDKPFCVILGSYGCAGEYEVLCCDTAM
jgi:hypothetical protein